MRSTESQQYLVELPEFLEKAPGNLTAAFQYFKGAHKRMGTGFLAGFVATKQTTGNGFKIKERDFMKTILG